MKISVAMATYNGEKYIEEQLRSILNQTHPVDEVVITDDRSTDQTVEIINRFIRSNKLNNWTCVINEENLGFRANFKKAISLVSGDLVFLSDQDDIWVKDRVEILSDMMEKQSEIGVLSSDFLLFRNDSEMQKKNGAGTNILPQLIPFGKKTIYLRSLGCAMCFRRDFYRNVEKFWTDFWAHDVFLWCASVLLSKSYRTSYCSVYHRVHEKQFSGHRDHSKKSRISLLERTQQNQIDLLNMARQLGSPFNKQKILQKNLFATTLRLELLEDRKISNMIPLLRYIGHYHSSKSYLVELRIALKG